MKKCIIENKEKIIKMINEGYTRPKIANELGIGTTTLGIYLKENNLTTNGHRTDLTGKRFTKLVVIQKVGYSKNNKCLYLCKCDCGNIKTIVGGNLSSGDTISCGCDKGMSKYKETMYRKSQQKIGEKYGRLTIIDIKYNEDCMKYDMVCRCNCGTISLKSYNAIKKGEILSCGCYCKEVNSKRQSNISYFKDRWFFIKNGEKNYCRSSYEVIYANYLIANNIDFEYEPRTFKLDEGKRYTPDFYIINEDLYIEIKGVRYDIYDKSNQRERVDIFKDMYDIKIYHWNDLVDVCNLPYKTYRGFKYNADKINIKIEDYLGKKLYL